MAYNFAIYQNAAGCDACRCRRGEIERERQQNERDKISGSAPGAPFFRAAGGTGPLDPTQTVPTNLERPGPCYGRKYQKLHL